MTRILILFFSFLVFYIHSNEVYLLFQEMRNGIKQWLPQILFQTFFCSLYLISNCMQVLTSGQFRFILYFRFIFYIFLFVHKCILGLITEFIIIGIIINLELLRIIKNQIIFKTLNFVSHRLSKKKGRNKYEKLIPANNQKI